MNVPTLKQSEWMGEWSRENETGHKKTVQYSKAVYSSSEVSTWWTLSTVITDKDVQSNTLAMIKNILNYTRENHPSENGIALKDKSLSPKKSTTCKGKPNRKRFPLRTLAKRKKKNSFQKRFGTAADQRNAKLNVGETKVAGVAKRKRVGAVLETRITCI